MNMKTDRIAAGFEPDLSVSLAGIRLANPTVLASGILGTTKALLKRVAECGAGAVTIKSISLAPRDGHANPTILAFDAGLINAVGYSNPGVEEACREFSGLSDVAAPVFASVIGTHAGEFVEVIGRMEPLGFAAYELPLSCPHTPGYGTMGGQGTPQATLEITKAARSATKKPVFVKISPNMPAIGEIAAAAREGGADAITAVNSLGPGMLIDVETRTPVLGFGMGGVTGPALRPIALRCVYDVFKAVDLPIIGVGGVSTGRHAMEMVMAGATAVGVGSAVHAFGPEVFGRIVGQMRALCLKLGAERLSDLIGAAHKQQGLP
ncbi:MAG TPA: dihydroorotate dehydrogenase [Candidatus Brocadiia bacterium]|nr:dihydroorotate dehydrogenase [Candidatus Brocadiia bacterium]